MGDVAEIPDRSAPRVDWIRAVLDDYLDGVDSLDDVDTDDLAECIDVHLRDRGGL
jgi:hypothetical protein